MPLQAFYDDSGGKKQGRWMTVAGFLGEAKLLASLTDEWERHLRASRPGCISYFKMDEAMTLDGEFRHWHPERRDEKVRQMAKIVDRDDLVVVGSLVDVQAHAAIERAWTFAPGRHALNQPYLLAFVYSQMGAVHEAMDRGATTPIDIFYDTHELFRPEIMAIYPGLKAVLDEPFRNVMPIYPTFRDDREFIMLQAADLIAGDIRLAAIDDTEYPEWVGQLCSDAPISQYFRIIDEKDQSARSASMRDRATADFGPLPEPGTRLSRASLKKARGGGHR